MTWVTDEETRKQNQELKNKDLDKKLIENKLQKFKKDYSKHKAQILSAIKEIQKQGLVIENPKSIKHVEVSRESYEKIKRTYFGLATEPWKFSGSDDPDPNKQPCYVWEVSHPNNQRVSLYICFTGKQLILRSGYLITHVREFVPHRGANIFNTPKAKTASNYGLTNQITFYQDLGFYDHHLLGKLPLLVEDGYGETCLGLGTAYAIVDEHIINAVYGWFKFASKDI